jgi:hypothetical protein
MLAALALAGAGAAGLGCAGGEFTGVDGGPSPSGSVDAAVMDATVVDSGSGFCATTGASHLFCEDFDQNVPGKFMESISNGPAITAGSRITADTMIFVSPPQSAEVQTPALLKVGDEAEAYLVADVTAPAAGSRLNLDVNVQVGDGCAATSDGTTVAVVQVGTYAIAIVVSNAGAVVAEIQTAADGGVANERAYTFQAPMVGDWVDLGIDLDLSMHKLTLTEGGTAVLNGQSLQFAPQITTSTATLYLGAHVKDVAAVSAGCRVHVDNVLFDVLQ